MTFVFNALFMYSHMTRSKVLRTLFLVVYAKLVRGPTDTSSFYNVKYVSTYHFQQLFDDNISIGG